MKKENYNLHIAISPLKNPERFELFVEKSVEFGIDEITPLICNHTEKKNIKTDRIEKVIISAMKQSLKALKTRLNDPVSFDEFVNKESHGKKLIAHCNKCQIKRVYSEAYLKGENVLIMIGPEGDFSEDEINLSKKHGFISYSSWYQSPKNRNSRHCRLPFYLFHQSLMRYWVVWFYF